jgi:hypothetical protein
MSLHPKGSSIGIFVQENQTADGERLHPGRYASNNMGSIHCHDKS